LTFWNVTENEGERASERETQRERERERERESSVRLATEAEEGEMGIWGI